MISEHLKRVILRELQLSDFALEATTLASEVPGWDSLKHVALLAAVEREFGVRFKTLEVLRLKNVGELDALLRQKLAAAVG
jgi:acyl carrier protein